MVRLQDIAKRAGVSVYTVSCALRGQTQVAEATRARLSALAEEMGYVKDVSGAILASRRAVRPGAGRARLAYAGYRVSREWTEPFRREAAAQGYEVEIVNAAQQETGAALARALWHRGVQGLWLHRGIGMGGGGAWEGFDFGKFTVVKLGRLHAAWRFPVVRHDAFEFAHRALREVFLRGFARVAVVLTRSGAAEDDDARLGAVLAYRASHVRRGQHLGVRVTDWVPASDRGKSPRDASAFRRWLERERPDVVLGFPWTWYYELERAGVQIGRTVGFASIVAPERRRESPDIDGCDRRTDEVARQVVRMLHQGMVAGQRGMVEQPPEVVIEPVWRQGVTLGVSRVPDAPGIRAGRAGSAR